MTTPTTITFGQLEELADGQAPSGFFKRIHFPVLAMLDTRTGDGRLIRSKGFGTRELPLSILQQQLTGMGHDNSVVVGRLDTVTVKGKTVSGDGWLTDTDEGRAAYEGIRNGSYRGNSVDLAEVKVGFKFDFDSDHTDEDGFFVMGDDEIDFIESKLAATTLVTTPAFANAHATVTDDGEEVVADAGWSISLYVDEEALTASLALEEQIIVPADAFRTPEPDVRTPLTVTEDGRVFGHLGLWNECHKGVMDQCVMIPHSRNGYASFLKRNVLTDEGLVPTGPIMLFGGHPKLGADKRKITDVYGGIENAWADVTIHDGKLGPWMSGTVRPGVDPEKVYAARASSVSGHWFSSDLYAIVSVNAEGFDVPRQFSTDEHGNVSQLIATATYCECNTDDGNLTVAELAWLAHELAELMEEDD